MVCFVYLKNFVQVAYFSYYSEIFVVWDLLMLTQMVLFLTVHDIPSHACSTIYLPILVLMVIWITSKFLLSKLCWDKHDIDTRVSLEHTPGHRIADSVFQRVCLDHLHLL